MISLDQVKLLEEKVEQALAKIIELKEANAFLKTKYDAVSEENQHLKSMLSSYELDQSKIEQGILNALNRLNTVESTIYQAVSASESSTPLSNKESVLSESMTNVTTTNESDNLLFENTDPIISREDFASHFSINSDIEPDMFSIDINNSDDEILEENIF